MPTALMIGLIAGLTSWAVCRVLVWAVHRSRPPRAPVVREGTMLYWVNIEPWQHRDRPHVVTPSGTRDNPPLGVAVGSCAKDEHVRVRLF